MITSVVQRESKSVWKSEEDFGKPNCDLPNQEKNQYWIVYWCETWALFTQETDQELLIGPLREVEKTGPHHTPRGNENQEQ